MAMSVVYTNFCGMLVHENRGGVERQYVSDPLGSLVGELDSNQNLTYTAEYWPYGEVQTETGTKASSWSFVGLFGYFKDLASLLYVRARHYLPQKSRWLTVDALWANEPPYIYSYDTPATYIDINGEQVSFDTFFKSCISKAGKDALKNKLKKKKCADAVKNLCGTDAMSALKSIPMFFTHNTCAPKGHWFSGSCFTAPKDPRHPEPGAPCVVKAICLNTKHCDPTNPSKQEGENQACILLWELGNACDCRKYGTLRDEHRAAALSKACGCNDSGPGGILRGT